MSEVLPQLRRCNGKSTWKVCNRKMEWFDSMDDVPHDQIGNGKVLPGMFPPTAEEAATMHLERCIRLLPHHQNTGGFFVAVLRKTRDLAMSAEEAANAAAGKAAEADKAKKAAEKNQMSKP